ncbi:MAG: hypothetical protein GY838_00220 [bacterium]|nr:hypothetical protein [bacterium]
MCRQVALTIGGLVLMASVCFGQLDTEPNRLGIYCDLVEYQAWRGIYPDEGISVYIVLANPTMAEIHRWEARFGIIEGSPWLVAPEFTGGGVNTGSDLDFEVFLSEPITCEAATVLATVSFIMGGIPNMCLYLSGIDSPEISGGLPVVWAAPDQPVQVEISKVFENGVGAVVSDLVPVIGSRHPCETTVSTEDQSWSALKALYR